MIRIVTGETDGQVEYKAATPKKLAQDIIADAIRGKIECLEMDNYCSSMTAREEALVHEQLQKVAARLYKMLGFEG